MAIFQVQSSVVLLCVGKNQLIKAYIAARIQRDDAMVAVTVNPVVIFLSREFTYAMILCIIHLIIFRR